MNKETVVDRPVGGPARACQKGRKDGEKRGGEAHPADPQLYKLRRACVDDIEDLGDDVPDERGLDAEMRRATHVRRRRKREVYVSLLSSGKRCPTPGGGDHGEKHGREPEERKKESERVKKRRLTERREGGTGILEQGARHCVRLPTATVERRTLSVRAAGGQLVRSNTLRSPSFARLRQTSASNKTTNFALRVPRAPPAKHAGYVAPVAALDPPVYATDHAPAA